MLPRLAKATLAAAMLVAAGACVSRPTTTTTAAAGADASPTAAPTAPPASATVVTLHQEGGFAGLVTDATVDGVAHRYQKVTRHFCGAEGASCPPPLDSASGALADTLASRLGDLVDTSGFFALRADYGTDPRLRDGMVYTLTVTRGARTATVRGDDSTRPPAAAALAGAALEIIERARGRR